MQYMLPVGTPVPTCRSSVKVGDTYNDWTVIGKSDKSQHVKCQCVCGTIKDVAIYSLTHGTSTSCGCSFKKEQNNIKVGDKFGDWTVIGPGRSNIYVTCKCVCGKVKEVNKYTLVNGTSAGCGCTKRGGQNIVDLTGQRFGSLTVIKKVEGSSSRTGDGTGNRDLRWVCLCDCGKYTIKRGNKLKAGISKQCEECTRKQKGWKDLTGMRFGRLTVLEYAGDKSWFCRCDCGNTATVRTGCLLSGDTKSCRCLAGEYSSLMEIEWADYLKNTYGLELNSRDTRTVPGIELDIFEPSRRIAIEVNGDYWHSTAHKANDLHFNKTRACFENRVRLIHLWEHDDSRKTAVKNLLHIVFGKEQPERTDVNVEACEAYYVQYVIDRLYLGNDITGNEDIHLAVKIDGETVGCLVAQKEEQNKVCIHGFCYDGSKVNGKQALRKSLSLLKVTNTGCDIEVAVDISKFTGQTYIDLGFKATKLTGPQQIIGTAGRKQFVMMDSGRMVCTLKAPDREKATLNKTVEDTGDTVSIDFSTISENDLALWKSSLSKDAPTVIYDAEHDIRVKYHPVGERAGMADRQREVMKYVSKTEKSPIHIFEYELADERKRNIIASMLKGKTTKKRTIWARNTEVKLGGVNECKEFINMTHLSGALAVITPYYKCVDEQGNILGVLQVGGSRFEQGKNLIEILRLAWRSDVAVVGGTEKLFEHMIRELRPQCVVTYSDIAKFTGGVYERIGMKRCWNTTQPGYHWYNGEKALSRYQCQKHKLLEKGLGNKDMTEVEIMEGLGYWKVYDYGNWKYIWEAPREQ